MYQAAFLCLLTWHKNYIATFINKKFLIWQKNFKYAIKLHHSHPFTYAHVCVIMTFKKLIIFILMDNREIWLWKIFLLWKKEEKKRGGGSDSSEVGLNVSTDENDVTFKNLHFNLSIWNNLLWLQQNDVIFNHVSFNWYWNLSIEKN